MDYQQKYLEQIYKELDTNKNGLNSQEAKERITRYGLNELKEARKISALSIFLRQFKSPIVWILIAALIISLFAEHKLDSLIIGVILLINARTVFMRQGKGNERGRSVAGTQFLAFTTP